MWPNPQIPANLVIFTEETPMENFIFCTVTLCEQEVVKVEVIMVWIQICAKRKPESLCNVFYTTPLPETRKSVTNPLIFSRTLSFAA